MLKVLLGWDGITAHQMICSIYNELFTVLEMSMGGDTDTPPVGYRHTV